MKKTILGLLTLFSIVAIIGVLFIFQSSLWGIASHPKKEDVSEVSAINEKTGGFSKEFMEELRLDMIDILLSKEIGMPKYADFLEELEKTCPYYVTSGTAYRGCLGDLLEKKDKNIEIFSDELVKDIQIAIAEKKNNYDSYLELATSGQEAFLEMFPALRNNWRFYRDALCEADHATSWIGSNHYGFVATCKLYESEKYRTKLTFYRYLWVFSQVEMYLDKNWEPETKEFKDLIAKENDIGI